MLKQLIKNIIYKPKYRRITNSKFNNLSGSGKKIIMFGTPSFGNLGDHAIAEAEAQYVKTYFPEYDYLEISFFEYLYDKDNIYKHINSSDLILIHGGGYLGTLWQSAQEMVEEIISTYKANSIIIFPQTIFFDDSEEARAIYLRSREVYYSHENLLLFVRDQASYDIARTKYEKLPSYLVPDIVTFLEESKTDAKRKGVLLCMRNDKEKVNNDLLIHNIEDILSANNMSYKYTDTNLDIKVNEQSREAELSKKFAEFRNAELVITDRLHGMLFCLITGTPCIALNNISKKVEGAYRWIEGNPEFAYIKIFNDDKLAQLDKAEIESTIKTMLACGNNIYKHNYLNEKLDPIKNSMEAVLNS